MNRETDRRNYHKIHFKQPFANGQRWCNRNHFSALLTQKLNTFFREEMITKQSDYSLSPSSIQVQQYVFHEVKAS